jgi:hypothetical protein
MNDILLTHGYFLAEDEKEQQIMKPYPPLGLLYLSAYLTTRRSAWRHDWHLHKPHDSAVGAGHHSGGQ